MKPEEITAALNAKGFTVTMLADVIGKRPSSVSAVIYRHTTSVDTASKIAKVLGKDIADVFPDVKTYSNAINRDEKMAELKQLLAS
ncbi:helix-turn-helix domain-containing protein [Pseudoalteromonas sp. ASV78]|uniref:helix-turn-helix domain-containing protein n=1 Tax=Pseudoalteromonas sp. ASV78 TaxID=3397851 RepID=UPI0039FC1A81